MSGEHIDPITRFLEVVGARGKLGRELALRADAVRAAGVRGALARISAERNAARADATRRERNPTYFVIWSDAARELDASVVDHGGGFLELRRKGRSTWVWNHWIELDGASTIRLSLDKALVHRLVSRARLPVPRHLEFAAESSTAARRFLEETEGPCIVKPVNGSGGSGVTGEVRTHADFVRAKLRAQRIERRLLIEEQLAGECFRFLFLDGSLLGVVRRRPPSVIGDGSSTIRELIAAENQRRLATYGQRLQSLLLLDLDCALTLRAANLSPASVPPPGERVRVKTGVGQNATEDNEAVTEPIADDIVAEAGAAARAVGLRLAGVDVVTRSLRGSLRTSGGAIIEVNGTPGLHYHYEVANPGQAQRVAVPVLHTLLEAPRVTHPSGARGTPSIRAASPPYSV